MGELRIAQAEYDSADVLVRQALEMAKRTVAPTDPLIDLAGPILAAIPPADS